MFLGSYASLRAKAMDDTSFIDGEHGISPIADSLKRIVADAGATHRKYVYFVGDASTYTCSGYEALINAKSALLEWNTFLDSLSGAQELTFEHVRNAENLKIQLAHLSAAPVGVDSNFVTLWASCPDKLVHVDGFLRVAACLQSGGKFPDSVRSNPLFRTEKVLNELSSEMFNRSMLAAKIELSNGSVAEYGNHVAAASAWARFSKLTGPNAMWIKVHTAAVAGQGRPDEKIGDGVRRMYTL
jgi:hypothetical protein